MPTDFQVVYIPDSQLKQKADSFLARYHETGTIPVPIEKIIEFQLKLDIIPVHRLRRDWDTDAWLTCDMTAIYVDQYEQEAYSNRYRFSLAHEIAHAVLHQRVYHALGFNDITSWKKAQTEFPQDDYGQLEWQAYVFAGLVLVPTHHLTRECHLVVEEVKSRGIRLNADSDFMRRTIAKKVAARFAVSGQVIEKRLDKEGWLVGDD